MLYLKGFDILNSTSAGGSRQFNIADPLWPKFCHLILFQVFVWGYSQSDNESGIDNYKFGMTYPM